MRIRQVKPSFWSDVRMADLPAPVRLFYIGLWMQADDAGWFRWDVPQMAAELYGFEARGRREKNVSAFGDALETAGRITRYQCGHGLVGTMAEHQRLSGATKQVLTFTREHERECMGPRTSPRVPAETRTSPPGIGKGTVEERVNGNGKGTERLGTGSADARAQAAPRPLMSVDEILKQRDLEDAAEVARHREKLA